jgi:hypothetical protein
VRIDRVEPFSTTLSGLLATSSAVGDASEVLSLVAGWITLRAALAGFFSLVAGRSVAEIAIDSALAAAASVPSALLLGLATCLYLVLS